MYWTLHLENLSKIPYLKCSFAKIPSCSKFYMFTVFLELQKINLQYYHYNHSLTLYLSLHTLCFSLSFLFCFLAHLFILRSLFIFPTDSRCKLRNRCNLHILIYTGDFISSDFRLFIVIVIYIHILLYTYRTLIFKSLFYISYNLYKFCVSCVSIFIYVLNWIVLLRN